MTKGDSNDLALVRIVKFSSELALGTMAALLYSSKQVSAGLRLEFSLGSGVALVLGVACSRALWCLIFGKRNEISHGLSRARKRWFVGLSVILSVGTLAPFGYALKDLPHNKAVEAAQGTGIALGVLTALGLLFRCVTRFLESDSKRASDDDPEPTKLKTLSD